MPSFFHETPDRGSRDSRVCLGLIAFKTCYWAVILVLILYVPAMNVRNYRSALQHWPRTLNPTVGSHLATWDGAHYLYLSEVGYTPGSSSCAFYPLLPLLSRSVAAATGNHLVSGLLVCNGASLLAAFLFYKSVKRQFSKEVATLSVLFLLAFPGSLFFQFVYSEAVFFLLLMILWWALERKLDPVVYMAGFLLALARPVGLFAAIPLFWHFCYHREERGRSWLILGPILGFISCLLLFKMMTGNLLEPFSAQRFWNTNSFWNIFHPIEFTKALIQPTGMHEYRGSIVDRVFFLAMLCLLPSVYKINRTWFWWVVALGVMPAMIATLTSFTRYLTLVFPVFIAAAVQLARPQLRWVRIAALSSLGSVHLWLLWRHLNFEWAG